MLHRTRKCGMINLQAIWSDGEMKHRRRGYLASLADAFSDGYNGRGHSQPMSFIAHQDMQYHKNKHRKHAVKNVWHKILGAAVLIVLLLCICGSCI